MAFDPVTAERVRRVVANLPGVSERRMFGGLAFLLHRRMFIGIRDASLMARVGQERHQDALAMPSVRVMDFTGRPMKGYVYLDPPAIASERDLQAWVMWCADYVAKLPTR